MVLEPVLTTTGFGLGFVITGLRRRVGKRGGEEERDTEMKEQVRERKQKINTCDRIVISTREARLENEIGCTSIYLDTLNKSFLTLVMLAAVRMGVTDLPSLFWRLVCSFIHPSVLTTVCFRVCVCVSE